MLAACVHAVRRGRLHDRMHPLRCQIERCRDGCSWCGRSGQLQTESRPLQAHSIAKQNFASPESWPVCASRAASPAALLHLVVLRRAASCYAHASMLFIRDSGTGSFAAGILSVTQHHQVVRKLR